MALVEIVVAIIVMSVAVLGLAGANLVGIRTTSRAREDSQYMADVQQVVDSLMARGFGNSSSGSATIRGRAVSWTVGSSVAAPQQITVIAARHGYQNRFAAVADTMVFYLAKATPGT